MKVMLAFEGHGHGAVRIAGRRKREIGQRENRAALNGVQRVQMMRLQRHLGRGRAGRDGQQFDVRPLGKLVVA